MMSVDVPTAPGLVIASDYFQSGGKEFVLFVDLFSSWTEYFKVSSRRPETLIQKLRQFMTQNGVPRILYSDKGSAYDSLEFRTFCKDWNIELVTCSGEYPQGNGTAESAVKRVKKWLSGANSEDELARAILAWHQTPITDGRPTPAQIHLGRNVRDELSTQVSPCTIPWKEVHLWRKAQKQSNAKTYDKRVRELPELKVGARVFVSVHGKWRQALIESKADRPRSYVLRLSYTGAKIERNRIHLRVDKTRTVPVNVYSHFSADEPAVTKIDERRSRPAEFASGERPEVEVDREEEVPSPVRQEALPPVSVFQEESPNEEDYRTADEEADVEPPIIKTKKSRTDRTQIFLARSHVSRVGRESKKIVRYDPSAVLFVCLWF
jgi:hypothetical protein